MIPHKFMAIKALVGGGLSQVADGTINYHSGQTPPSDSAIDAKLVELTAEWNAQEYARKRQAEYPSIVDVTVALAEKEEGDSTMWDEITAKRAAVKAKYAKP